MSTRRDDSYHKICSQVLLEQVEGFNENIKQSITRVETKARGHGNSHTRSDLFGLFVEIIGIILNVFLERF